MFPIPFAQGSQATYFVGLDGQLLWCNPANPTTTGTLETNGYIPDIPGSRGPNFLDSKFVSKDGAWWGCHWIRNDGKLGFIVNGSEPQSSEFVECNGLWLFNLEVYRTRRPILVSYWQTAQGVSTRALLV